MAAPSRPQSEPLDRDSLPPACVPALVVIVPFEGDLDAYIRGCNGEFGVRERMREWLALDDDLADLVAVVRRIQDRQAA
jgi:hypothetical protein